MANETIVIVICSNNGGYKHRHLVLVMSFRLSFPSTSASNPSAYIGAYFSGRRASLPPRRARFIDSKPRRRLATGRQDRSTGRRMSGDGRNNEPQMTERKRGGISSTGNKLSTTRSAACREYLRRDLRKETSLSSV